MQMGSLAKGRRIGKNETKGEYTMKLTVTKDNLVSAIKRVVNAVSSKITLPALSNILVEAEGDSMILTASDLELSIEARVPAMVFEAGATTLPAKKFMQIAGGLPNGDVTIETTDDEQSTLSCQKAYFKIHGLAAENFQKPEEVQEEWTLKLPVQDLVKNLIKVSYAKSMDEDGRRYLNGVLLSVRGDVLTIAATDGRRLALVEKPLEAGTAVDGDIILPAKASVELTRSLDGVGEVTIRVSQSTIVFETADVVLTSKLIEGTYPNYRQVIPKTFAKNVAIPRAAFSEALARVSMVVSDSSTSVRLTLGPNTLTISANSNEVGESSEPVEIEYSDEPFEISFNPQFVSEPLKYLDCEQLIMQVSDDLSPVALTGDEGFLYIIMPMRG